jgi:hypothetical protein
MIRPGGLLSVSDSLIIMIRPGGLLSVCDWLIIMIRPGGLLLVVPHLFALTVSVLWVGLQKST